MLSTPFGTNTVSFHLIICIPSSLQEDSILISQRCLEGADTQSYNKGNLQALTYFKPHQQELCHSQVYLKTCHIFKTSQHHSNLKQLLRISITNQRLYHHQIMNERNRSATLKPTMKPQMKPPSSILNTRLTTSTIMNNKGDNGSPVLNPSNCSLIQRQETLSVELTRTYLNILIINHLYSNCVKIIVKVRETISKRVCTHIVLCHSCFLF